jgi:hypothetical protein
MFHPQGFFETRGRAQRLFQHACAETARAADGLLEFITNLFQGHVDGFLPCDTAFHDFDHTLEATRVALDLLAAHRDNPHPQFTPLRESDRLLVFAAVLFHDTGYLKRTGDCEGSGAKYSAIHVGRSCFLAWDFLPAFGFTPDEIRQVQNAICATAVTARMDQLPFRNPREWLMAAIVATGDMLGQMAAPDYPERLPGLYLEFREAGAFSHFRNSSFGAYQSLQDLLAGTEKFFYRHVLPTLETELRGVYRLLTDRSGRNVYLDHMRLNVAQVSHMARLLADRNPGATLPHRI